MSKVSGIGKAFEGSLERIDELIDGMRAERARIWAEFERRQNYTKNGILKRGQRRSLLSDLLIGFASVYSSGVHGEDRVSR